MAQDISNFIFEYEDYIRRLESTTKSSSGYMYNLNYIIKNVNELFDLIELNKDFVVKWCFDYLDKNRKRIWLQSGIDKWKSVTDEQIKTYWEPLYPLIVSARESTKRFNNLKDFKNCFIDEIKKIHEGKECEDQYWWDVCNLCEKQEYEWKRILEKEMKLTGNILLDVNRDKRKEYIESFPFDAPEGWEPPRLNYDEKFVKFNSPDIDLSGNKTISQEILDILPHFLIKFNILGYYWYYNRKSIDEYEIFFRLWNNYDFILFMIKPYREVFQKLELKSKL